MTISASFRSSAAAVIGSLCAFVAFADDHEGHQSESHPSSEFVLFVSAETHSFSTPALDNELNEDANFIGDAVFAVNQDRFRLFGEYQLSNAEHDLERFQVGFEAIVEAFPQVRIVAISGGGNFSSADYQPYAIKTEAYLAAAKLAGAHAVLTKPFKTHEVLQAVEAALNAPPNTPQFRH
jgi:hypothetical protein